MQKGVRRNHRSAALSPSLKLRWTTVALAEVVRAAQRPRCSPAASALRATACHAVAKRRREGLHYAQLFQNPLTPGERQLAGLPFDAAQGTPSLRRGVKGGAMVVGKRAASSGSQSRRMPAPWHWTSKRGVVCDAFRSGVLRAPARWRCSCACAWRRKCSRRPPVPR